MNVVHHHNVFTLDPLYTQADVHVSLDSNTTAYVTIFWSFLVLSPNLEVDRAHSHTVLVAPLAMVRKSSAATPAVEEHPGGGHIVVTAQQSRYALDAVDAPASKEVSSYHENLNINHD
jgi:hypothetical protein